MLTTTLYSDLRRVEFPFIKLFPNDLIISGVGPAVVVRPTLVVVYVGLRLGHVVTRAQPNYSLLGLLSLCGPGNEKISDCFQRNKRTWGPEILF